MPSGGCQGATFSQEGGPCGGQRASQTHGELPPSIFLMALSHFIIDFNSAMCRARGKQGLCDVTPAQTAGRGPIPKQVAGERSYTNGHICCYGKLGRPSIRLFIVPVLLCHRKSFHISAGRTAARSRHGFGVSIK